MKKLFYLGVAFIFTAGLSFAGPKGKTYVGNISDTMCGLKHGMAGKSDKECTVECVNMGSKYVLADTAAGKVYELSDQEKPKVFAGQTVKVTGTLKGKTINVASIEAAK